MTDRIPRINRLVARPGATPFHSSIITVEWTDGEGRRHTETGSCLNPAINSLCRYAEFQGLKSEYVS